MSIMSPEWKFKATIYDDWLEVQDWCSVNIGEFDVDWYKLGIDPLSSVVSGKTATTWYFKDEAKYILFTLRWQ